MADVTTAKKRIRKPRTSRQKVAGAEASGRHRAKMKDAGVPSVSQIDKTLATYLLGELTALDRKRGNAAGMKTVLREAIEETGWPANGPVAEAVVARASRLAAAKELCSVA